LFLAIFLYGVFTDIKSSFGVQQAAVFPSSLTKNVREMGHPAALRMTVDRD